MPCKCDNCGYKYATEDIDLCMNCGEASFTSITEEDLEPPESGDASIFEDTVRWFQLFFSKNSSKSLAILAFMMVLLLLGFFAVFVLI